MIDLYESGLGPVATTLKRDPDFVSVFDFSSEARKEPAGDLDEDDPDRVPTLVTPPVAYLRGFAYFPGYVPGEDGYDSGDFDVFDSRSAHAADDYQLLTEKRELIEKALRRPEVIEGLPGVVVLERGFVAPELRGKGLILHLMREVKDLLEPTSSLLLLKAHPDGESVTGDDCRRLAKYYQSEKELGLKAISSRLHPGWLAGLCW